MTVDFKSAALLQQLAEAGGKPLHLGTIAEARALSAGLAELSGPAPEMARTSEHQVSVRDGAVTVRVLVPVVPTAGVIVWYHGGGWVIGSINEADTVGRKLAERTSCAVVLVEYRLAPEHPYPVPIDDSTRALEWVGEHLEEIAGRRDLPLIVGGDSAGGNIAAVVARRARDRGGPPLTLQVLIYPVTDADFERPSYTDPASQLLLTRDGMLWFWGHYLPDVARRMEPDASPLQAADLSGLPPAVIATAELDPLRDEGEDYARRLEAAGVPVNFQRYERQMHAFFTLLMLPGSELGFQQVVRAVQACVVRHGRSQPAFSTSSWRPADVGRAMP